MYKVVSLFSGGGGLDIGFLQEEFEIVFSVEQWDVAVETLNRNKVCDNIHNKDIRDVDFLREIQSLNLENKIDVLIGGPPCPPFSQTRHYLTDKKKGFEDSVSGFAVPEYFRALREIKPKVFLFENVAGFTHKTHKSDFEYTVGIAESLGYELTYKVVNTADYGVPQTRKRFFMIGVRKGLRKFEFPDITHSNRVNSKLSPWITAGEVLEDSHGTTVSERLNIPGGKYSNLLDQIPPGDNYLFFTEKRNHPKPIFKWKSRYWTFLLKLSPNRPSWTIQASFSTNQGPFHWDNRFLRLEEIKRLQTFPDDYIFCGDFKEVWRQIGNAVPVKMASVLAKEIKIILEK